MATVIVENLIDDLDKSPADESISFTFEGAHYQIDLNNKHAKRFREQMAPYLDAGRRVRSTATRRSRAGRDRSESVRSWAREQGIKVSDRGRIAATIMAQYDAAHA